MNHSFTARPYQPDDLQTVLDIVRSRPPARLLDYPSLADLQELLETTKHQETALLWQKPDGQIASYTLLQRGETYCSLLFESTPDLANAGQLQDLMIDWGEQTFRQCYRGSAAEINTNAFDDQPERMQRLEAHGFIRLEGSVLTLTRDLSEPIPDPQLPEGFTIRALAEGEAPAWVELHRAAFGTLNMTLETRQSMMALPDYDPELDLVAVAPDGSLVAYVFSSISRETNALIGQKIGFTDPVATHPHYQRLGLSRALLLTALRLLKARGMEIARLGTSSDNLAMQRTAETAGYRISGQAIIYEKPMTQKTDREA